MNREKNVDGGSPGAANPGHRLRSGQLRAVRGKTPRARACRRRTSLLLSEVWRRARPARGGNMKKCLALAVLALVALVPLVASAQESARGGFVSLRTSTLLDKIRGGWAGKMIGCTYGGPTEFRLPGHHHPATTSPSPGTRTPSAGASIHRPGLYDDVYMDLTFVDVLEERGLDAPAAEPSPRPSPARPTRSGTPTRWPAPTS